jgi:hypothetical protein
MNALTDESLRLCLQSSLSRDASEVHAATAQLMAWQAVPGFSWALWVRRADVLTWPAVG